MAERRMFAKSIIDSDDFLDMPMSARLLYYDLSMRADDDGFVNAPKRISKLTGASDDDLKVLCAKRYIIPFDSGIVVIRHWKIHNYIQNDRYKETMYKDEKKSLDIQGKVYEKRTDNTLQEDITNECIQNVSKMDTQVRLGKASQGKNSLGKARNDDLEVKSIGEVITDRPTLADISNYIELKKYKVIPERFYSYYSQREFPKNWKAVIDKWEANEFKRTTKPKSHEFTTTDPNTITKDTFGCSYIFEEEK